VEADIKWLTEIIEKGNELEKQGRACTLATRLFDHSPNSSRPVFVRLSVWS